MEANGKPLAFLGERIVTCVTRQGHQLRPRFLVGDVTRPMVSVGALSKAGYRCEFTDRPCIKGKGCQLPLLEHGNLYYLPVQVGREAVQALWPEAVLSMEQTGVKVFECGGSTDAMLACWFEKEGFATQRLTLPQYDLSRWTCVRAV